MLWKRNCKGGSLVRARLAIADIARHIPQKFQITWNVKTEKGKAEYVSSSNETEGQYHPGDGENGGHSFPTVWKLLSHEE